MRSALLLCILCTSLGFSQKITLRGVIIDSVHSPLPSATVLLLSPKDSTLVNFAASTQEGKFELRNVTPLQYLLSVTYVGYRSHTKLLSLEGHHGDIDLGEIVLQVKSNALDEVTVTAQRAPVTIKKDTIEFNADSFKTKENALVEELLKKLPGVEVDNDGTIRAQGEQVRRITVDGKNFFGTDPKIATRNLPADAISKVQVFDRKSDQATFTGIDDGQREKTINLELKEEKRKGAFGNLMAGAGTNERFTSKANINRFRRDTQLSFLGMANNTNESGFGMEEYLNFTGGARQMMSGRGGAVRIEMGGDNQSGVPLAFGNANNGILTTYAGGLNFNKKIRSGTELSSSYFYNQIRGKVATDLERINYLPGENSNRYTQYSFQTSENHNHRVNAEIDHRIDSMNSFKLSTSLAYNTTILRDNSANSLGNNTERLNSGARQTYAEGENASSNSTFLWRHRFRKRGRTLSVNVQFLYGENERYGWQSAIVERSGSPMQRLHQQTRQTTNNAAYAGTVSFTEPLGNRKYLEFSYNFRENRNDLSRMVYDILETDAVLNEDLSVSYVSAYQYHRGALNFKLNRPNYNVTVGTQLQQTYLSGEVQRQAVDIRNSYQNLLPVLRFNYEFSNSKRLSVDYETTVTEPTIQQLQPAIDNSDPLNLYVGNPELRPAYNQNMRLNFSLFNPGSFISVFAFLQGNVTRNAITVSQHFGTDGIRTSKPVNVPNSNRLTANASAGLPIDMLKSRVNLTANASNQRGEVVVNDVENTTTQQSIGGRFRYEFRPGDSFDLGLGANISREDVYYELTDQQDQRFYNNSYFLEVNTKFLKHFNVSGNLDYLIYRNQTQNFSQEIPMLNLSVSRFLLKARSGELKVSVHNLLDQNVGYSQTATLNYFERQETSNLGRYFMVSFVYSLNRQLNPMGSPRGGMIRIMR